ncbi:pentapeptide repeat-containing protein [Pseudodesulfovibrio pelocollis]|uniref:pentapeptide repeat-containing protein n=1 Tax=Pseudodesulfovibrio pelocollis TaxID=3051432 RepID=UPI00255AAAB1|nr:pentapeptide repeat-containing protein [Pseudodesulfovibrio sp. SB368]
MACCKCEEHGWNDPQPVVYTDPEDGNVYCLFHAPAEHKGMSVDAFNGHVSERIQAVIDLENEKASCDLSGTIFPGDICFESGSALPNISFEKARFKRGAVFDKACFGRFAFFIEARFGGGAVFHKASFGEFAFLNEARFEGEAVFIETSFRGDAYFGKARFGGGAFFREARFGRAVSFIEARFGGNADFSSAQFNGPIRFDSIKTNDAILKFAYSTVPPSAIIFENCDPTCLDLVDQRDLTHIHFINSSWEKNGRIKARTEADPGRLQSTRDFYQRMKAKYKAENNEYEASKWHVAEKEAQLKLLGEATKPIRQTLMEVGQGAAVKDAWKACRLERNCLSVKTFFAALVMWLSPFFNAAAERLTFRALWLYKYSSGYGEKPFHALFWLAVLVLLPALPVLFPGSMLYYLPLMREHPGSDVWVVTRLLMVLWQIFITVQAALFAFALRNRFRR